MLHLKIIADENHNHNKQTDILKVALLAYGLQYRRGVERTIMLMSECFLLILHYYYYK